MSGRALQCRTDGSFLGSRFVKRIKLDRALEQDKQAWGFDALWAVPAQLVGSSAFIAKSAYSRN